MNNQRWFKCRKIFKYQIILFVALYLWTFFYYLPTVCKDHVYSPYFNLEPTSQDVVMRAWNKNSDLLRSAIKYLNWKSAEADLAKEGGYTESNILKGKDTSHQRGIDITIGIVTTQRSVEKERGFRLGYLTQVLASIHKARSQDTFFRTENIFICNVDPHGLTYKEASMWSSLFKVVVKHNTSSPQTIEPWEVFEREKQDYQFCLRKAWSYQTPYVMILEDDVVPNINFFKVVHDMLMTNEIHSNSHFGFMKLYFPERWAGFSSELSHFVELAIIAFCGGIVGFTMAVSWSLLSSTWLSRAQLIMLLLLAALFADLLAIGVGRPYILNYMRDTWYHHRLIQAKGCCTQAVLYPSYIIQDLLTYLDYVECDIDNSVDLVIDQFAKEKQLQTFLVEPNVVKHIGMLSSLRSYSKNAAEFI